MQDSEKAEGTLQVDHFDWGNDLLVNLFPLWKESILCDTTIICENDEKIHAHSILLAAASPSLYSFLRNSEQGIYEFKCTQVPRSIWKNVVTFIYTGRLDISKEEMVPTYNLATKLAMFNFCKQLAGQLSEHGLVRGGTAKVTAPNESEESEEDSAEEEAVEQKSEELQTKPDTGITDPGINTDSSPDLLSMDLVSDEGYFMSEDLDVDVNAAVSDSEGMGPLVSEHRYECPICFLNFKRQSALKKHHMVCTGNQSTKPHTSTLKKVPPLKIVKKSSSDLTQEEEKDNNVTKSTKTPNRSYKNMYVKTPAGKFQCNLCSCSPKTYHAVISHIRVKHMGMKYTRPTKKDLVQSPPIVGSVEGVRDAMMASLSPEVRQFYLPVNHSYYSIKCRECGKLIRNRASFIMHVKMHHMNTSQTKVKIKKKVDKTDEKVSGQKGPKKGVFECHLCGRTFDMKMHLGSHMKFHTAATPTSPTQTKKTKVSKLYRKIEIHKK